MLCVQCSGRTRVVRTRQMEADMTERVRVCEACGTVFRTVERPETDDARAERGRPGDGQGRR